jgi:UDP-glucose 4-epimerase
LASDGRKYDPFAEIGLFMTVLITGGAGYIGGHTVLAFVDRGEVPIVLDDLSTGNRDTIPSNVPFVLGDVGDRELVTRILRQYNVDAILHFAAKIVVSESVADPLGYYFCNSVKTHALLEAAVKSKIKYFVFSSSAAVYGNPDNSPVSEEALPAPLSPYGMSKLISEHMLRDASTAHHFQYVILRYFNVAGADPDHRLGQSAPGATHLVKVALEAALGRRPCVNIYGEDYPTPDGTCVRDYVHVTDLAQAHLAALDHLRSGGESCTLNCGYGRGYSVKDVVETVKKVTGVDFDVYSASRRPGDPISLVANSDRLKRLGWAPKLDQLQTIISHAFDWERKL